MTDIQLEVSRGQEPVGSDVGEWDLSEEADLKFLRIVQRLYPPPEPEAERALTDRLRLRLNLRLPAVRHLPGKHDQQSHSGTHTGAGVSVPGHGDVVSDPGEIATAMLSGRRIRVDPSDLHTVLSLAKRPDVPPVDLTTVSVRGEPNAFSKHAREIPRSQMPQLPEDTAGHVRLKAHFAEKGWTTTEETADPRSLMATQNEIDAKKVSGILGAMQRGEMDPTAGKIVISENGEVVDGHHRFAAATAYALLNPEMDVRIPVMRVSSKIDPLLDASHEFARAEGIESVGFGDQRRRGQKTHQKGHVLPPGVEPDSLMGRQWWEQREDGTWVAIVTDASDDELFADVEPYDDGEDYDAVVAGAAQKVWGSTPVRLRHLPNKHDQADHNPNKAPGASMGSQALVTATTRAGGVTYNTLTHDRPTEGFVLSIYPERSKAVKKLTRSTLESYVEDNADLLQKPDHYLGTWNDTEGGQVYLDVSVVTRDRARAEALAREHDQIAIWDAGKGEEITIDRGATSGGQAGKE